MRKSYPSKDIVVTYDPRKCIHAKRCVEGSPAVFKPGERPWIQPEGADADALAATVAQCPTGSLRYERLDGGPAESVPTETVITAQKDGPAFVHGPAPLVDAAGNRWEDAGHRYALCRCGGSGNKPYCDNTHLTMGFEG
jgi:uncharacterized Fe-S cluster protein YjdI/CDGSH-type Zn-finger protein